MSRHLITCTYRNWKGETRTRRLIPQEIIWGKTQWNPEEQWLMRAIDADTNEKRDFALRDCDFLSHHLQPCS